MSMLYLTPLVLALLAQSNPTCLFEVGHLEGQIPNPNDQFGKAIDWDGETLVVGALNGFTTGTQLNEAHVFVRQAGSWVRQAVLMPGFPTFVIGFGGSVAVDGDRMVVGAPGRNHGPPSLVNAGSAFLFVRTGSTWSIEDEVFAADPEGHSFVGRTVDIDGDTAVVGAQFKNEASVSQGAVYVFVRNGTAWTQQAKLTASFTKEFGSSVAVDGDTIVVGADQSGVGAASFQGRAYAFVRNGTTWTQQASFVASDGSPHSNFGSSVDIDGDVAVVGAHRANPPGTVSSGEAYVFRRTGTSWTEERALWPATPTINFGNSVAIDENRVAVGAPLDQSVPNRRGAVFLFSYDGVQWNESERVTSPLPGPNRGLGHSVALSGQRLLAGTDRLTLVHESGMVVDFLSPDPPSTYCSGKTNSLGCVPFLTTTGFPAASGAGDFRILANDQLPGELAFLFYGFRKAQLPFHGGEFCVKTPWTRWLPAKIAQSTGTPPCTGRTNRDFNSRIQSGADPALTAGKRVFAQVFQRDPADPAGFGDSLSDAVSFTIYP